MSISGLCELSSEKPIAVYGYSDTVDALEYRSNTRADLTERIQGSNSLRIDFKSAAFHAW